MSGFMIDEKKNLVESQGYLLDERKNLVKDQGYVIDEKKNLVEYQGGGEVNPPITEEVNMIKKSFSFSGVMNNNNSSVDCSSLMTFLKTLDFSKVISLNLRCTNTTSGTTNNELYVATDFTFAPINVQGIDLSTFSMSFSRPAYQSDPWIHYLSLYQLQCMANKIYWIPMEYSDYTSNGILNQNFELIFYIAD